MNTRNVIRNVLFLSSFLGAAVLPYQEVIAQGRRPISTPDSRVSRELWDVWRQGFDYYEKGEMKMISCKFDEALPLYRKSLEAFTEVRRQNPRWNRSVIDYRMALCRRRIMTVQRRAREERENRAQALARAQVRLPSGSSQKKSTGSVSAQSTASSVAAARREFEIRLAQTARENELRRKQIADLQSELARLRPDAAKADSALRQISSLMKERDQMDKQLSALRLQLRTLQAEQRKSAPRAQELQKLLDAERNKSNVYARSFRERSAEYRKLEEQYKILAAGKSQLDAEFARVSKQHSALLKSSTEMVRQNADRLESLNRQLAEAKKESASYRSAMEKTQTQMREISGQLQTLRSGKLTSEENTKQIRKDFADLRKEQEKSRAELEKLRADRIRLEHQCVLLNGQITQLKKDLALNMEQRNDFAKANNAISKQFSDLDKSFRKSVAENAALRKDLEKAVRERALFASKVNDQLNESLKESLRNARSEVTRLKNELDTLKKQGNALELKASLAIAQSKILAGSQAQKSLQEQIIVLKERSTRTANELQESQKQLRQSREQLALNRQEQEKLNARVTSLQEGNRRLAAELKTHSESALKNMQTLRRQENSARSALDEALKRQIELNKSQAASLQSSNQTVTRLTEMLRTQNERLAKVLAESEVLKQQKNLLQARIDQEKLLAETRQKQARIQAETLQKKNADLLAALREKENRLQVLQAGMRSKKDAGTTAASSAGENEALRKEIASLRDQVRDLSAREQTLRKKGDESAKIAVLVTDLNAAKKKYESALQKAVKSDEKVLLLTADLKRVRQDLDRVKQDHAALTGKSSERTLRMEKELASARQKLSAAEKDLAAVRKESAAASKTEVSTLKEQLASARKNLLSREQELKTLQTEREKIRTELAAFKAETRKSSAASGRELERIRKQSESTSAALALERKALEENRRSLSAARKSLRENAVLLADREKQIGKLKEQIRSLEKNLLATGAERSALVKDLDTLKKSLPDKDELAALRRKEASLQNSAAALRKEKSVLEQTISSLQFRLGSTQSLLEKVRNEALRQSRQVGELKARNKELTRTTARTVELEKSLSAAKEERSMLVRNAAVTEKRLKDQLRQYAAEILTMRDAAVRQKEALDARSRQITSLKKDLSASGGKIRTLEKKLAEALSGEERKRLVKQIDSMTKAMKVLASSSADELVREAANKNIVVTELLAEIQNYKAEIARMKKDTESSRLAALRAREEVLQAQDGARLAVEGARLARAELAMLKAEVLSGSVNVTLLERSMPRVKETPVRITVASDKAVSASAKKVPAGKVQQPAPEKKKSVSASSGTKKAAGTAAAKAPVQKEASPSVPTAKYKESIAQGIACEKSGDLGMALFHYWNAVDQMPESPEPYLLLVKLHLKRKEAASARKAYDKAVSLGAKPDPVLDSRIKKLADQ